MAQQMAEIYQFLYAFKLAVDAGQQLPGVESLNKLRAEAARLPEPMRTMMQSIVDGGARFHGDRLKAQKAEEARQLQDKAAADARQLQEKAAADARAELDKRIADEKAAKDRELAEGRLAREKKAQEVRLLRERIDGEMRAQIADFCVKAIGGRYPFVRTSGRDVTPEDFGRLFAPNQILDGFFQKHLAPHVDTTQSTWRFRDVQMGQSGSLVEFQRAQVIRDVFFRGGGNTPSIQLELKAREMDATISQFTLDVDGKVVRYAHGPQVAVRVQFPGPSGRSQVRVTLSPPSKSGSSGMTFDGPWALFRMFDEVKIEETNQFERFVASINLEGRRAVFEILASSVKNPFRLPELNQFHCPTQL
jgi:type VI protein secretion system component VasK